MKKILNVLLGENYLTQKPNAFIAYPLTKGRVSIDDVIRMMKQDGMEIHEATAKDIVERFHKKVAELVLAGFIVNIGLAILRPIIKGIFLDKIWDPAQHAVKVAFVQGSIIRSALADTEVHIIGKKNSSVQLFSVVDKTTGNTDGQLKVGRPVELRGKGIKIAGEADQVGIFFTNTDTGESIKIPDEFIALNNPKLILFVIPDYFVPGQYKLSLITKYLRNNKQYKKLRSAVLPFAVNIE
ncbi:DNA-binding domain-containing protein [Thermophagus sp. OGC60D27]|uniref:DNA-binding domain-containing protein n=1 Tax=Thermophagus sp. OGC60D27 TaxID=3458415 RepID=UPI0040379D64